MSKLSDGLTTWKDKDTNLQCVIIKNRVGVSCYVECPDMDISDLRYAPESIETSSIAAIEIGYFLGSEFIKTNFASFNLEDWGNNESFGHDGRLLKVATDITYECATDECTRLAKFIHAVRIHLHYKSQHEEFNPEDKEDGN